VRAAIHRDIVQLQDKSKQKSGFSWNLVADIVRTTGLLPLLLLPEAAEEET
jgi:hypothetical protein